jgi:hypothetical protein
MSALLQNCCRLRRHIRGLLLFANQRYCIYAYIRYGPWDKSDLTVEQLNDPTLSVAKWESFVDTCSDYMKQYMKMELEMKDLLKNVIDEIEKEQEEDKDLHQDDWMAFVIYGTTNHTLFKLPVKGEFKHLDGELLKNKQDEFKDVECIVIDEYACTSQEMLGWIDNRCRQFKKNDEYLTVIMVGDPAQHPPVGGNQMFSKTTAKGGSLTGLLAYREFKTVRTPTLTFPGDSFNGTHATKG